MDCCEKLNFFTPFTSLQSQNLSNICFPQKNRENPTKNINNNVFSLRNIKKRKVRWEAVNDVDVID